jgi:cyclopropane fatty-acyl-phospholipid synthase-like methyltransferase
LRCGGLELLGSVERPFDKVLSVNVIQFIRDKRGFFEAIAAVMSPGGTVATTCQPRDPHPTREDALRVAAEIRAQMQVTGFTDVRAEELALDPIPAICVLGTRLVGGGREP